MVEDSAMRVNQILVANKNYVESGFHKPLPLGVNKRIAVLTCMDSRIFVEKLMGFELGDAEIIRNAGGRVTEDVIRSLMVCQDLLKCDTVLVVHHTDCGGQHALTNLVLVMEHAKAKIGHALGKDTGGTDMHPIVGLEESVRQDVDALRKNEKIKRSTAIYGFTLDTATGVLSAVTQSV